MSRGRAVLYIVMMRTLLEGKSSEPRSEGMKVLSLGTDTKAAQDQGVMWPLRGEHIEIQG